MKSPLFLVAALAILAGHLPAVDTVTVKAPIADITVAADAAIPPIDLRDHFEVMGVQGSVVRFNTNLGAFTVEMFDSVAPNTVTNFRRYVDEARFTNSIVHRSQTQIVPVPYQIIQGGSFLADVDLSGVTPLRNCTTTLGLATVTCQSTAPAAVGMTVTGIPVPNGTTITAITNATTFVMSAPALSTQTGGMFTVAYPPIALEAGSTLPNTRGTIAMARQDNPLYDSATNGWFFNIADNSTAFPPASALGYAVFGRVMGPGMTVVDAIAALPIYDGLAIGPAFRHLPYTGTIGGGGITLGNLVVVNTMTSGPVFPTMNGQTSFVNFVGTNNNTALVAPAFNGSTLNLPLSANRGGRARIQIRATDMDGNQAAIAFFLNVTGGIPTGNRYRDMNNDGNTDLLFQNNLGQLLVWFLNGSGVTIGSQYLYTGRLYDWKVVGTPNLNNDGNTDLLFQNNLGQLLVWFLNGSGATTGSQYIYTGRLYDWKVVGTSDLNGDGNADILFQNNLGQLLVWFLNGSGVTTGSQYIYTGKLYDWRVAGTPDFNNDGNADILFQNNYGQLLVWFLNGSGVVSGYQYIYTGRLYDWKVAGTSDWNNDNNADILFQNNYGQLLVWFLNGSGIVTGSQYLYTGKLDHWRVRR